MAETVITDNLALSVFTSIILFFVAALAEIGGGYLVWKWIRERKGIVFGLFGGIILFIYGIIPTLQPSNFGRVYAAVRWNLCYICSYMGSVYRQKKTRSIRGNRIRSGCNRCSDNILQPTLDAKE